MKESVTTSADTILFKSTNVRAFLTIKNYYFDAKFCLNWTLVIAIRTNL